MPGRGWPGAGAGASSSTNPGGGGTVLYYQGAPYDNGDDASASDVGGPQKDAVIPLNVRALEEARLRGWGTRSLDLGHEPSIHGGTLYQLRALLFARCSIESLCVPALPESRQVYAGIAIPTLRTLTLRCRYAEHPDVLGALEAFADAPAHAGIHTLELTDATQLPIGLGRLRGRNRAPLKTFLAQLTHFHISGRSHALPGEAGAQRHLLRFIASMNRLRTLKYLGYVPGMPVFQVLRVLNTTLHAPLEELTISQASLEGSTPREDAQLYKMLTSIPAPTQHAPVTLDLTLGVALDAPHLAVFASMHGVHLRTLDITLTYDALTALRAVTTQHAATLRVLSVTVLPAPSIAGDALWAAFTSAVTPAEQVTRLRFAPMLSTHAPMLAPAHLASAVPAAIELAIHAPGAVSPGDAHEAYTALLNAATNSHGLQRLHVTLTTSQLDSRTEQAAANARRTVPDIVLGKREEGDDTYKAVKIIDESYAKKLWPVVFLLKPWLANSVIVTIVALVLITVTIASLTTAIFIVRKLDSSQTRGIPEAETGAAEGAGGADAAGGGGVDGGGTAGGADAADGANAR